MPSSDLNASQSILDFSSVLIFCFFPPMRPRRLDIPAGRLALRTRTLRLGWDTAHWTEVGDRIMQLFPCLLLFLSSFSLPLSTEEEQNHFENHQNTCFPKDSVFCFFCFLLTLSNVGKEQKSVHLFINHNKTTLSCQLMGTWFVADRWRFVRSFFSSFTQHSCPFHLLHWLDLTRQGLNVTTGKKGVFNAALPFASHLFRINERSV